MAERTILTDRLQVCGVHDHELIVEHRLSETNANGDGYLTRTSQTVPIGCLALFDDVPAVDLEAEPDHPARELVA